MVHMVLANGLSPGKQISCAVSSGEHMGGGRGRSWGVNLLMQFAFESVRQVGRERNDARLRCLLLDGILQKRHMVIVQANIVDISKIMPANSPVTDGIGP